VTTFRCPLLRCGNRISEGKIRFTPLLWCKSLISAIFYNFSYKRSAIALPKQHNKPSCCHTSVGILKSYTEKFSEGSVVGNRLNGPKSSNPDEIFNVRIRFGRSPSVTRNWFSKPFQSSTFRKTIDVTQNRKR
jgi:hypothetical protein